MIIQQRVFRLKSLWSVVFRWKLFYQQDLLTYLSSCSPPPKWNASGWDFGESLSLLWCKRGMSYHRELHWSPASQQPRPELFAEAIWRQSWDACAAWPQPWLSSGQQTPVPLSGVVPCFLSPHLLLLPMLRLQSFSQGCFFLQWSMLDTRFFINAVMHLCSKPASSDLLEEWSHERGMMVGIEFTMTSDWITLCMPASSIERIGGWLHGMV